MADERVAVEAPEWPSHTRTKDGTWYTRDDNTGCILVWPWHLPEILAQRGYSLREGARRGAPGNVAADAATNGEAARAKKTP